MKPGRKMRMRKYARNSKIDRPWSDSNQVLTTLVTEMELDRDAISKCLTSFKWGISIYGHSMESRKVHYKIQHEIEVSKFVKNSKMDRQLC